MIGRPDARQLQQPRRPDRAGRQEDFARRHQSGAVREVHPGGPAVLDHDPPHLRAQFDGQVLTVPVRGDIGHRGRGPAHVALGQLVIGDAILLFAVHIEVARDAQLRRCLEIGLAHRKGRARFAHAERAALAVVAVVPGLVVFGFAVVGQHVVVAPPCAAHLAPFIVVQRVAAGIDLRVDRRAAADDLGLGVAEDLVLHVALRDRVPAPAADPLGHLRESGRQVVERLTVAAPRLEQEHLDRGILRQAPGQDRARGSAAYDDEIICGLHVVLFGACACPAAVLMSRFPFPRCVSPCGWRARPR